jgi:non-specific serine/threonine protein kinase
MSDDVTTFADLKPLALHGPRDPDSWSKGITYYRMNRVQVEYIDDDEAVFHVKGSLPTPYEVTAWVKDGAVNMECTCPYGRNFVETLCKHKVAAFYALNDHVSQTRMKRWDTVLSIALEEAAETKGPRPGRQYLVYSLQQQYSTWRIVPLAIDASQVGEIPADDIFRLAERIRIHKLSKNAKGIRAPFVPARYRNLLPDQEFVARTLAVVGDSFAYYGSRELQPGVILPQMRNQPIFFGSPDNPLKSLLTVEEHPGNAEIEVRKVEEGLEARPVIRHGNDVIPGNDLNLKVVSSEPAWVVWRDRAFRIDGATPTYRLLADRGPIVIPDKDRDAFLTDFLPRLVEQAQVFGDAIQMQEQYGPPVRRIYLSEDNGELKATLKFAYGQAEVDYEANIPPTVIRRGGDDTLLRVHREAEVEMNAFGSLASFGLKRSAPPGVFALRAKTDVVDFLLRHVPSLAQAGFEVYGEDALASARINRNKPTLTLRVSSGIDWFDVQAIATYGDVTLPMNELRQALRKQQRYVKLADGSIGAIPEEWVERFRHLLAFGEATDEGMRLSEHHIPLIEQLIEEADDSITDAKFEESSDRLRQFQEIQPKDLPSGLLAELRPYQKSGYDWLHFLHEFEVGGCLADDMGVGKTVQALAFLLSLRESGQTKNANLIVMPRSLLFNWERESMRFTPGLRVMIHGDGQRVRDPQEFQGYDLVLTTYGIMLRDIELLRSYPFHYVVLDESQAIKNPISQTARAARMLNSDHRLALTGTPVENSTLELWSQFAFLNPGLLGTLDYFRDQFANAIEKKQDDASADTLRRLVFPFILRRTKDQVAKELPPRTERILLADMEPDQRRLYETTRDKYRAELMRLIDTEGINNARMRVLEGLLRLRQIANHPRLVAKQSQDESGKFSLLLETLETLHAEGHKALIFSQFVQMLKLVREQLDARGVPYQYLDGQTKDRQERVDAFQHSPQVPFFLISLRAGGVGLNLTAADYVIHIDPWWNPAVERQATDRTHRIGQDKPVFVYKLITRDTVEEKILELQERKRVLAEQLISTEAGLFKALTKEDIGALFT